MATTWPSVAHQEYRLEIGERSDSSCRIIDPDGHEETWLLSCNGGGRIMSETKEVSERPLAVSNI